MGTTVASRRKQLLIEVAARAVLVIAVVHLLPHIFVGDITYYHDASDRMTASRLPYRAVHWEFPPLTLLFVLLEKVSFESRAVFLSMFAAVNVGLELASLELLRREWPEHRRDLTWIWTASVLPVAALAWFRLDFLAVFFATLALIGLERRRPTAWPIVAGFATKLWPSLLLVVVAAQRQWRAFATAVAGCALVIAAWYAFSPSGFRWFVRYRAGAGLEVESLPASVRLLGHHGPFRVRSGAWVIDVGGFEWVDPAAAIGLGLFSAALGWWAYRRRSFDSVALGGALVVSSMLFSRLLSAQYIVWLGPFVAVLWARGHRTIGRLAMAAAWLTFIYLVWFDDALIRGSKILGAVVLARNVALVALLVMFVRAMRSPDPSGAHSRDLSGSAAE